MHARLRTRGAGASIGAIRAGRRARCGLPECAEPSIDASSARRGGGAARPAPEDSRAAVRPYSSPKLLPPHSNARTKRSCMSLALAQVGTRSVQKHVEATGSRVHRTPMAAPAAEADAEGGCAGTSGTLCPPPRFWLGARADVLVLEAQHARHAQRVMLMRPATAALRLCSPPGGTARRPQQKRRKRADSSPEKAPNVSSSIALTASLGAFALVVEKCKSGRRSVVSGVSPQRRSSSSRPESPSSAAARGVWARKPRRNAASAGTRDSLAPPKSVCCILRCTKSRRSATVTCGGLGPSDSSDEPSPPWLRRSGRCIEASVAGEARRMAKRLPAATGSNAATSAIVTVLPGASSPLVARYENTLGARLATGAGTP
mmetsp:Transcript_138/g.546  ORF Transcript_138/g.546 Transcript_138/m.546 type:complete len:374 (+) Transcript_138:241-1362(+)